MKVVIYTCITGDYDWLLPPVWDDENVKHICFATDAKLRQKGWELRPINPELGHLPPDHINRWYKFHPHLCLEEFEASIYIDANIRILKDPRILLEEMTVSGAVMGCMIHPERKSIFEEAEVIHQQQKISNSQYIIAKQQVEKYKEEGLPEKHQLTANNILIRIHSHEMAMAMQNWWKEFTSYCPRDQLSLPYVVWKEGLSVKYWNMSPYVQNPYFRVVPHKKRKGKSLRYYFNARRYHGWHYALLAETFNWSNFILVKLKGNK